MSGTAISKRTLLAGAFAAAVSRPTPSLAAIRPDDAIGAHLPGIDVVDVDGQPVGVSALFATNQFDPAVRDFLVAELARSGGHVR